MLPSGSSADASTTCTSRSASAATDSVDLNASTSWCGQLADEPDGVGEQHLLAAGQVEAAGGGVERGEEAVLDEHAGVGEPVEERRLAGVRVADDRDALGAGRGAAPCAAWRGACRSRAARPRACGCAAGCAGGRPRAASRRDRGCRSGAARRGGAAGLLRQRGALAADARAAGSGAAPARPAPCPPGCGRSGRRCRGSPRCGRWRCARAASRGCAAAPG